mmetsp:Transcript_652/g.1130  ORF Transcript_652/g.1130 Transcript_652/m.1130 type:complete len:123 (+) Transcript_652:938-1306(+)
MIANYGFTHPLVPSCPSTEDWRHNSELWKRKVESLESEIEMAYEDMDRMDIELHHMHARLQDCNCEQKNNNNGQRPPPTRTTASSSSYNEASNDVHVRGRSPTPPDRTGIRRSYTQKSDLGL